jgi:hypothetical protein
MGRAKDFGVVIDRVTGAVRRVFNPDFDFQFAGHHVGPDEFMLRVPKADFGVGLEPNAMTLDQVHRIVRVFGNDASLPADNAGHKLHLHLRRDVE